MNQLACVYCSTLDELRGLISTEGFIEKANRLRLATYFPFENKDLEEQVQLLETDANIFESTFVKLTGIVHIHECIVPFLVQKIISPNPLPELRPFLLADTQTFWLDDIDVWYNFPKPWINFLRPLTPQAIFDTLDNSAHEF